MAVPKLLFFPLALAAVAILLKVYPLNPWLCASGESNGISNTGNTCATSPSDPTPSVKIISFDPLIIHVENFISSEEREYLLQLSKPLLKNSQLVHANGSQELSDARTSSSAYLPSKDPTVSTIARRAAEFQGFISPRKVELQVTSYQEGQQYKAHYDWFQEPNRKMNRLSTFFAILHAECDDCGTQFPELKTDWKARDPKWCEYMDCSYDVVTSKNIVGSAIFWGNLDRSGKGRHDTLHAGLPADGGTKVGMNIWTWTETPPTE